MKLKLLLLIGLVASSISYISNRKITKDELKNLIIDKYEKMSVTIQSGDPTYVIKMHTDGESLKFGANFLYYWTYRTKNDFKTG